MTILALFLSVIVGSFLGFFFFKNKELHGLVLSFSGAFLLSITLLDIFPHVYENHSSWVGLFVVVGVFLQLFLETVTKGAEHGHIHKHGVGGSIPYAVFTGLFIHAFIEGVPLQKSVGADILWAVVVHKIPVAMILFVFLSQVAPTRRHVYLFMLLFAMASPLGNLLGREIPEAYLVYALALASGVFLHISTVIIFESSDHHKLKIKKTVSLFLGFVLAYLSQGMH